MAGILFTVLGYVLLAAGGFGGITPHNPRSFASDIGIMLTFWHSVIWYDIAPGLRAIYNDVSGVIWYLVIPVIHNSLIIFILLTIISFFIKKKANRLSESLPASTPDQMP